MQHHDLSPDPWAQAHAGGGAVTPGPEATLPAPAAISPALQHLFVTAEALAAAHGLANEAADGPSRPADPAQRAALKKKEDELRQSLDAAELALIEFPARSIADVAAKLRRYGGILGYCQSAVPGTRTTHSLFDACLREADCDRESDEARWVIAVLRDLDRIAADTMPEAKGTAPLARAEGSQL